ncbi:MAG: HAMP domain-containing sensor histidine kinase [Eubacteriales bacterium]|nr:HAMP domain-containing sensor histidine kinase [Eubacteriales bacterium]
MEETKGAPDLLDLMVQPGFYVENFTIQRLNAAAEGLLLAPGMDIRPLIDAGLEEYQTFEGGCLYLRLRLSGNGVGASVTRQGGMDAFVLDTRECDSALQALSLAARELRDPLAAIMVSAGALEGNEAQLALLNRGIHQMLRVIGNMSDAGRVPPASRQETMDIDALFCEVFEKAAALAETANVTIRYQGLEKPVLCLADREQLERAALNLISNALKFAPAGGKIDASLTKCGKILRFSIRDNGPGFAQNLLGSVYNRYLRQPCIEEGRNGLGLGMVLVRSAAASHGGAVLIDQPEGGGARVSMTMAIRQNSSGILRSPVLRVDYAGEQDHALVELADCLPPSLYKPAE